MICTIIVLLLGCLLLWLSLLRARVDYTAPPWRPMNNAERYGMWASKYYPRYMETGHPTRQEDEGNAQFLYGEEGLV